MMKGFLCVFMLLVGQTIHSAEEEPIRLESNFIGDKEQPTVSYFIPWQEIGTPDKLQWNIGNKNDKTLKLIDRKVLLRALHIYQDMNLEPKTIHLLEQTDKK